MRWIKHMTATTQDERVAAYLDDCGPAHRHEGYGFFWMLLEIVASQIESGTDKCSATYTLPTWSRMLYCHHHTVSKYLGKLEVTGMVTLRKDEGRIEVIIPNLLKYRDEYSRKSGHSTERVRSKKQIQSIDTEEEKPQTPIAPTGALSLVKKTVLRKGKRTTDEIRKALGARLPWWEEFWRVYPCHEGMREAMDTFERRVTDRDLAVNIYHGAQRYAAQCASDPDKKIKYAQGWLNGERWLDEAAVRAPHQQKKSFVGDVAGVIEARLKRGESPW